ncbi:MAG: histone deacetylase [Desulfosarcinaceae bacterium]|jgi:acetoin utilization deacetylase AcuC-like enzyme
MILYDPSIPVSLLEFGIQIPIQDSRATKTFEALKHHPGLAPANRWHRDHISAALSRQDLLRVHSPSYVEDLYAGADRLARHITATYELIDANGNFNRYAPDQATRPLTELFERTLRIAAGTAQCGQLALKHGFCYSFSGGMHHAHADHGSGFCLINDVVIAARKLQAEAGVGTLWIIDTDAHKGDGTAALSKGDEAIRTLSIHMARGWPLDAPQTLADGTPNPVFTPSDIDIPIEAGEESNYLAQLQRGLQTLAASGNADLAIVVSGADPYEKDGLSSTAKLKLNLKQMMARDQMTYSFLKKRKIPAAYLMAGGYGEAVWEVYAQFLSWVLPEEGYGR